MTLSILPPGVPEPTFSTRVVRSLIAYAERAGVAREMLVRAADLPVEELASDDLRIGRSALFALIEAAIDATGDEGLGLHWGDQFANGLTLAPLLPLMAHAPTLGHALEGLRRYGGLLSDPGTFEIVDLDGLGAIRALLPASEFPRAARAAAEFTMLGFYRMTRVFAFGATPVRVGFAHRPPPYVARYARLFDGNARFSEPHTEVVFDRGMLTASSPHRDDDLHEVLRAFAERRILRLRTRIPCAIRVREVLQTRGQHRADMTEVARHLEMSSRSLRRRLCEEGTSFPELVREALMTTAKRYLREEKQSVQATAFAMGFEHATTFCRAFKKWTGSSPGAFRDGPGEDTPPVKQANSGRAHVDEEAPERPRGRVEARS